MWVLEKVEIFRFCLVFQLLVLPSTRLRNQLNRLLSALKKWNRKGNISEYITHNESLMKFIFVACMLYMCVLDRYIFLIWVKVKNFLKNTPLGDNTMFKIRRSLTGGWWWGEIRSRRLSSNGGGKKSQLNKIAFWDQVTRIMISGVAASLHCYPLLVTCLYYCMLIIYNMLLHIYIYICLL